MAKNSDEERRLADERRELLKMKQGLIEESELIPQDGYIKPEKPRGWKRVENFFYQYKWILGVVIFGVVVAAILIVQLVTKEREDLYVLCIATDSRDGFYLKQDDIERTLEKYCPDFDNNGYVHVGVHYLDLDEKNKNTQLYDADIIKFQAELMTGDSQMYLSDTGIISLMAQAVGEEIQFFKDLSDEYPDAALYEGCGLPLTDTGFTVLARWESCPDTVGIYVRNEYENMTGNGKDSAEQRERALVVFRNILENNVVSPDAGEE